MEMNEKSNRILDVAKARFERFGVKKTTMDEIAKDAGISKKTVYEHFRSKEDLFNSVFIREALKSKALALERLAEVEDPLEQIEQVLRLAVDYHWRDSFMIQVLRDADGLYTPYLDDQYRLQVEDAVLNMISSILQEGVERGRIREMDTRAVAYFFFKLFQSFTFAKTASLKGDAKDLEELVNFIMRGISK
ncbi:MAG: TetR/AcrR family transcriptional regulator [Deltaproteobacteria bacterium]